MSLTLDNSDGRIPLDYQEVKITRRLYRSGEAEYLVNGSKVRLKDIHQWLLHAALDAEAYVVVGQGSVDELILQRPEERRLVIDNAADIRRHQTRLHETRTPAGRHRGEPAALPGRHRRAGAARHAPARPGRARRASPGAARGAGRAGRPLAASRAGGGPSGAGEGPGRGSRGPPTRRATGRRGSRPRRAGAPRPIRNRPPPKRPSPSWSRACRPRAMRRPGSRGSWPGPRSGWPAPTRPKRASCQTWSASASARPR